MPQHFYSASHYKLTELVVFNNKLRAFSSEAIKETPEVVTPEFIQRQYLGNIFLYFFSNQSLRSVHLMLCIVVFGIQAFNLL
jgi:hypothetical protein